jgi:hypothetical protein
MGVTEFHIHVDARSMGPDVERALIEDHAFIETNFSGHPEGVVHFEPNHHLTLKCFSGREFQERFKAAESFLSTTTMRGYLEGEFIASDDAIEERSFDPGVPLDVRVDLGALPSGKFRETELHITMDRDRSDPRLIEALCATGMFAAYLPKAYGTAVVFTAQGDRKTVRKLLDHLTERLHRAGGAVAGSIKEELVVRWWLSHADVAVPPVVVRISGSLSR